MPVCVNDPVELWLIQLTDGTSHVYMYYRYV